MKVGDKMILTKAIQHYGKESQVDMCIEEMSELTKALLKERRCKNKDKETSAYYRKCVDDIIEEIADVQIMLDQMTIVFDNGGFAVDRVRAMKVERLKDRIAKDEKEQG